MNTQGALIWLITAGMLFSPTLSSPLLQTTDARDSLLVLLVTDQSVYLCPPCGDRLLEAYRLLAHRVGKDKIWVAVSGIKPEDRTDKAEFISAVEKRIQAFLRANNIFCPVLSDRSGTLKVPGGVLPACVVLDALHGSIQSFSLFRDSRRWEDILKRISGQGGKR